MENCLPNHPLVTVIVPIYNVAPYLRRCLDSVCGQRYTNLEIILVNDGSTDESGTICAQYMAKDRRVQVICQENRGLSEARNAGLDQTHGRYIFFVDSDDFLHIDCIQRLWTLCCTHRCNLAQCGIARGLSHEFSPQSAKDYISTYDKTSLFDDRDVKITAWGKLYHYTLLEGLRFAPGCIHEDEGFTYIPLYHAQKIICTSWKGYYYYQRLDSITRKDRVVSLDFMSFLPQRLDFFRFYGDNKQVNITYKEYAIKLMLAYIKAQKPQRGEILQLFHQQYLNIQPEGYLSSRELWILKVFNLMPKQVAFGVKTLGALGIWGGQYG